MVSKEAPQAITHKISGIKCDAPGCDYIDHEGTLENYPAYLNAPCPKCGANLLTQADLDTTLALVATCKAINSAFAGVIKPTEEPQARVRIRAHMDGSGIPRFEITEVKSS